MLLSAFFIGASTLLEAVITNTWNVLEVHQMDLFLPDRPVIFSTPIQGKVEQIITHNHPGRIKCLSSFWPAQLYQKDPTITLLPGQSVKVAGRQGITLLVVPEQD